MKRNHRRKNLKFVYFVLHLLMDKRKQKNNSQKKEKERERETETERNEENVKIPTKNEMQKKLFFYFS